MSVPTQVNKLEFNAAQAPSDEREWPIPVLQEGKHYYMEDGFMVFAEAYHLARGTCCGNSCRHCPFDHVNVK